MQKDERNLLAILKFELKFLEDGGYGRSPKAARRPQLVIEGSPTCMNFNSAENPRLEENTTSAERNKKDQLNAGNGGTTKVTRLYQKQHPKCANPACQTAFHWTAGGKFFRFRPDAVSPDNEEATADPPPGVQSVRHYWLCERCSHVFTLVYDPQYGVVLKIVWPDLRESAA